MPDGRLAVPLPAPCVLLKGNEIMGKKIEYHRIPVDGDDGTFNIECPSCGNEMTITKESGGGWALGGMAGAPWTDYREVDACACYSGIHRGYALFDPMEVIR